MPELPYASPEEFQRIVTHYPDVPLAELVPGTTSHIVLGERALVSFLTMSAGIHFPAHRHEAEQIMIVIDGYMDEIIEGKLYRGETGTHPISPDNLRARR